MQVSIPNPRLGGARRTSVRRAMRFVCRGIAVWLPDGRIRFVERANGRKRPPNGHLPEMRTLLPKIEDYPAHLEACWQEHLKPKAKDAPTVISLFAGCGGSSLGYSMAGFRELLADEHGTPFGALVYVSIVVSEDAAGASTATTTPTPASMESVMPTSIPTFTAVPDDTAGAIPTATSSDPETDGPIE